MLSVREQLGLLDFQAGSPEVVSLYLEIDSSQSPQRRLKSILQERREKDPRLAPLAQDLDRISEFVAVGFEPGRHRGLAAFSCRARGFWLACPLPEPVKDQFRVGDRPYLAPLLNVTDQYRRYGVALIDAQTSRFIEVYLGQAEECSEPAPSQEPPFPPPDAPHRHLKAAADQLLFLARKRGFERVIVGAPKELESLLINHLHSSLQNSLIIDSRLNIASPLQAVLEKVMLGEQQSRNVRESVLVHRLLDGVKAGGMGVVGLWETLDALQKGEVRMLLVRDGLAKMGRVCPACGRLALEGKRCLSCSKDTQPLFNLVSAMVQTALDVGCEVVRVLFDARLDHTGGVGAELKFKSSAQACAKPAPGKRPRS